MTGSAKSDSSTRIACDTNVMVSAFIAGGPPGRVIEEAADGSLGLVLLEPVLNELTRILPAKFDFDTAELRQLLDLLADISVDAQGPPAGPPEPVTGDPDDDLILACAVESSATLLVSGDRRHLLPVDRHRGVRILTPQALLAELKS
ncbi:MAG TPA: putative toxin-antitoxin system toxin component, PIN family [Solirubrobacterales bacterium]|nr:putative toxin-antitoxin system toxin component, PIN family [Solirubrobacterales bacterium]HNL62689.1 putative toxin-antitoxin system toxin component, PIN family [Solirubrobacterales bacterium]